MGKREGASEIGSPGAGPLKRQGGRIEMMFQRLAGDELHHQEGNTVLVDSDVVQLDDGRIGKLADDLGFAEELLLEAWTEIVQKGFEGDGSANNVVARFVDAARGPGAEVSEGFIALLC
jgi:hypothetical protein